MQKRTKLWVIVFVFSSMMLTGCLGGILNKVDLTMSVVGQGTVKPKQGTHSYSKDAIAELEATPAEGWEFSGWGGANGHQTADPAALKTSIKMNGNKKITAVFTSQTEPEVELTIRVEGQGTVDPEPGTYSYSKDAIANLEAVPAAGWEFFGWGGHNGHEVFDAAASLTSIIMDADKEIVAFFDRGASERIEVVIDIKSLQQASGEVEDVTQMGPYPPGFRVRLTAEASDELDVFLYWEIKLEDGSTLDARDWFEDYESTDTFLTVPEQNATVYAVFTKRTAPIEPGTFDYGTDDFGFMIEGRYGITEHAWDLSDLDTGRTVDFFFGARNLPDRFEVYYGTWDELYDDPDGCLLFATGWVSQSPWSQENPTVYPEGVQEHHWHEEVESWYYSPWNGGLWPGLLVKEAGRDVLFIRVEGRDNGTIWDYMFKRSL